MHGEFHIPHFIIPHPQPAPKKPYPIKGISRTYILSSGYAVNKLGVCLNPVPVYTFHGILIFIHLAVAQFVDGKLSFDVHFEIKGESYNGYAASYTNRQAYLSVKCAVEMQLDAAIEFLTQSPKWIESDHKRARIIAETEQIKEDIKALFDLPQQISLF